MTVRKLIIIGIVLLTFPVSIWFVIAFQIYWAIGINRWGKHLEYNTPSQQEAEEVTAYLRKVWYIPNHPKYWGRCKNIYYSVLHSSQVNIETKEKLYKVLKNHKVYGLNPPRHKAL
ncbi:hypothetical protein PB1_02565 [Bacillus methanolicus PB1]|uniref:Uncharacterized protein n=1 Tax=Bacillus methanolicus PB1 TaxID=997296 RepID=I3E5L5_BACMT|nr:hypothetical protein [Bacillus methanolicus]EIJ81786.1 hypothetical protein PB1_02565 [Bacillus methanolicus PB1]